MHCLKYKEKSSSVCSRASLPYANNKTATTRKITNEKKRKQY